MEKSYAQLTAVRNIKKAQIDRFFEERKGGNPGAQRNDP